MKEIDFKDRVPTHPGRITLTPVAGQANTYDLTRADEPIVEGSPIDKATYNSMVHSRLTGRYYVPTVAKTVLSSNNNITANPIPTSGWNDVTLTGAKSGGYIITSSSSHNTDWSPENAVDGDSKTSWTSSGYTNVGSVWWQIYTPTPIILTSIRVMLEDLSGGASFVFEGSANGTGWKTLTNGSYNGKTGNVEYTFTNTNEYSYYRFVFTVDKEYSASIYNFEFARYSIATYQNKFTIANGLPGAWTTGQRITIQTPASFSTAGIVSNTLNGVSVKTILQPNTRYELVYNGTAFDAKGV